MDKKKNALANCCKCSIVIVYVVTEAPGVLVDASSTASSFTRASSSSLLLLFKYLACSCWRGPGDMFDILGCAVAVSTKNQTYAPELMPFTSCQISCPGCSKRKSSLYLAHLFMWDFSFVCKLRLTLFAYCCFALYRFPTRI